VPVEPPIESPRSLADAFALLGGSTADDQLTPIAGGTDVMVRITGEIGEPPGRLLDLWRLDELRGITTDGDAVTLGALTTYTEIRRSAPCREHLPALVEAAATIGAAQIQNRGTLGGNIANASPAGDSLPVLAAANATIVLQSADAERRIPFTAFYTGYRASVRRADELIAAIEIPRIDGKQYWRKVGTRRAQAISKVMCAAVRGPAVTVALGSVAPTVIRLPRTEQVLSTGGSLEAAQAALDAEIAPIDDIRSTAPYRRAVSANLLRDFWRATS
jgi:CO/xanthine dehydrogenase FAD-binding subunit